MDSLNKLIEQFREFPGIGPRQARRFAYFLLTKNPSYLEELARLVTDIKKSIHVCSSCFRFFSSKKASGAAPAGPVLCPICADPSREKNLLMVVARDVDFETIEKSDTYHGLYFILGGTIPFLEKNPESRVRLRELASAVGKRDLTEIILSLNANPEGEYTADIVRGFIKDAVEKKNAKITILGRGLSTGSELEYADADTIKNALRNRA